jgi:predicted DNA-binding antitoxin AbrB/MazE fold protein
MISVLAVYENGVLRPKEPLALADGQEVSVTVVPTPPTLTPAEWESRIRAAKTIQEWVALANACPNPDPDFDVVKAINETRRLTGFRVPDPEPEQGEPG